MVGWVEDASARNFYQGKQLLHGTHLDAEVAMPSGGCWVKAAVEIAGEGAHSLSWNIAHTLAIAAIKANMEMQKTTILCD